VDYWVFNVNLEDTYHHSKRVTLVLILQLGRMNAALKLEKLAPTKVLFAYLEHIKNLESRVKIVSIMNSLVVWKRLVEINKLAVAVDVKEKEMILNVMIATSIVMIVVNHWRELVLP
jgi:hypothetical protein